MVKKPRAYTRAKRKDQIIRQFAVWYHKGDNEPKTMYRIAKALDMTPQYRLNELLNELVAEGVLGVESIQKPGRWEGKGYLLVDLSLITKKYAKRRIIVKHRGTQTAILEVPPGQMGLWS